MSGRVDKRIAIVTGAGSGIGKASAIRLAEEGATIICADINGDSANETAAQIRQLNFKADGYELDVSDSKACDLIVSKCVENFGAVDILVNNAGVNIPGVFHEVSNETIDRTLNVNV